MLIEDRIGDDERPALGGLPGDGLADGVRPLLDDGKRHEADAAPGLPAEHAHEVGVAHGGQRVVAHASFR